MAVHREFAVPYFGNAAVLPVPRIAGSSTLAPDMEQVHAPFRDREPGKSMSSIVTQHALVAPRQSMCRTYLPWNSPIEHWKWSDSWLH